MAKSVTSVSEDGMTTVSTVREFEFTVDATGEDTQDTLETLLGDYAACYVPALRVAGRQRDVDELGRIQIDVTGELNDDDKLDAIAFDITVEAVLEDGKGEEILARANELCKVHDALKDSLKADMTISGS